MRLLVTRPRPEADETASRLRDVGHEPVIAPMLHILPVDPPPEIPDTGVQAFLVTSVNGARAVGEVTDRRDIPVLAVGDVSAEAARRAGFQNVESAAGNVEDLAELARRLLDPAQGTLIHSVGTVTAGNLAAELRGSGFDARPVVLYEAQTQTEFPNAVAEELVAGNLDGVLLFSPRTARTFVSLADEAGLLGELAHVRAYCLSRAVAENLEGAGFLSVEVAERPSQESLFELL